MSTTAQFWLWWSLAAASAVWLALSELRSGEIGGDLLKLRRAEKPRLFWSLFTVQNGAVLIGLAYLTAGIHDDKHVLSITRSENGVVSQLITGANKACAGRNNEKADVGITDYEACLGNRANMMHPANRQLCRLAKGTISPAEECALPE